MDYKDKDEEKKIPRLHGKLKFHENSILLEVYRRSFYFDYDKRCSLFAGHCMHAKRARAPVSPSRLMKHNALHESNTPIGRQNGRASNKYKAITLTLCSSSSRGSQWYGVGGSDRSRPGY